MVLIKVTFNGDVRRVNLDDEALDFATLKFTIGALYGRPDLASFTLKYLDDENDAVSLTNDEELKAATQFAAFSRTHILRLVVHPVVTPSNHQPQQQQRARCLRQPHHSFPFGVPMPIAPQQQPKFVPPPPPSPSQSRSRPEFVPRSNRHAHAQPMPSFAHPVQFFAAPPHHQQQQPEFVPRYAPKQLSFDLMRGLPFGAMPFAQGRPQQQQQQQVPHPFAQRCRRQHTQQSQQPNRSLNETVDSLLDSSEVKGLMEMFGCKPNEVKSEVDEILRIILPPEIYNSAQQQQQAESNAQAERKVRHGAFCDHCKARIEGVRYKCGVCSDYDLCETCEELSAKDPSIHDPSHLFVKIRRALNLGAEPLFRQSMLARPQRPQRRHCWQVNFVVADQPNVQKEEEVVSTPEASAQVEDPTPIVESTPEVAQVSTQEPEKQPEATSVIVEELDENEQVVNTTFVHAAPAATPAPVPEQEETTTTATTESEEPVQQENEEEQKEQEGAVDAGDVQYPLQEETLLAMGFCDVAANRIALQHTQGNLRNALHHLIDYTTY